MNELKRPMRAVSLLPPGLEHTDSVIINALLKCRYPVWATSKVDGIRAVRLKALLSRTLHLIPNNFIRKKAMPFPYGTDMELFSYNLPYYEIESIVMSEEHPDSHKIGFYLLDIFSPNPYYVRLKEIEAIKSQNVLIGTDTPRTQFCEDADELFKFFKSVEDEEGEGICFRLHDSPYKQGKSTLNEQYLVKLSRYIRAEAKIIGFEEQMLNNNKKRVNALGLTERSDRRVHIFGKDTLGSFIVESDLVCPTCNGEGKRLTAGFGGMIDCSDCNGSGKMTFKIGTGVDLTEKLRQEIWDNQSKYLSQLITYKTKVHGKKVKPRHPVWCGFRNRIDL
jgi:hypothetical protein